MKHPLLLPLLCLLLFSACQAQETPHNTPDSIAVTDALGTTAYLDDDTRVVCGYASFAECWLLSGGSLLGVTEDAVSEHALPVGDAAIIGTTKHIDLEKLVALAPEYVILSADLSAHLSLRDSLSAMGIPCGYFRVDTFEDYAALMAQFCAVHSREDLYQTYVTEVEADIQKIRANIPETDKSVLLIRAFSTGMKAKTDDNLAGQILREFGLTNIADGEASLLEDLSMEHITREDPDYIFAMTMGNEAGARQFLETNAVGNPAWRSLTAVQNGRYYLLPKELFHYKPNHRWSESYAYLARCIFPEIFSE